MSAPASPGFEEARFASGSIMRHVIVLTATGSVGLMAIFFVDFLSLLYISWLRDASLTAGVGFATTVLFLATSINIGLMIGTGALVARAVGARDREGARRLAASCLALSAIVAALVTLALLPCIDFLLTRIGAEGVAHEVGRGFLWITLPSNALMALGMGLSGLLRALGDARRAMNVTLAGGIVTAFLDPLLIFGFGLGVTGAAIATVVSRLVFVAVGLQAVLKVHKFLDWPRPRDLARDFPAMFAIAGPAVMTTVATPIANAFVLRALAPFGDAIVAGNTILDRLTPLAFGALFALTGAVGPIFGQNLGARRFDRLVLALRDALLLSIGYVVAIWAILVLGRHQIAALFGAIGATADYVAFFCLIAGLMWGFNGALFVANAAFNNLGFALYSTAFNWGRATVGTVPFAMAGAALGGPAGVLVGVCAGSLVFGAAAIFVAFRKVRQLQAANLEQPAL